MGTSFVHIDWKGFWMQDSILELWLRLLALHLEDPLEENSKTQQIRDGWLLHSHGFFAGCVQVGLGAAVATAADRDLVVTAIRSLIGALEKGPEQLDHGTLNILGFQSGGYPRDIESARLIEVGNAFLALIAGEIQSDASSKEFMPGCWIDPTDQ